MQDSIDSGDYIGNVIRHARIDKMLSQKELANRCGMSASHLSKIETGRNRISTELLKRVSLGLDLDISKVFELAEDLARQNTQAKSVHQGELGLTLEAAEHEGLRSVHAAETQSSKPDKSTGSKQSGMICIADPEWLDFHFKKQQLRPVYYRKKLPLKSIKPNAIVACCRGGERPNNIHLLGRIHSNSQTTVGKAWNKFKERLGANSKSEWKAQLSRVFNEARIPDTFAITCCEIKKAQYVKPPIVASDVMGEKFDPRSLQNYKYLSEAQIDLILAKSNFAHHESAYGSDTFDLDSNESNSSTETHAEVDSIDVVAIEDDLQASMTTTIGSGCRPRRHANVDEKCLGINAQTKALSSFITSASGEFCLAVFGRWGRGKTFLLQELGAQLASGKYQTAWFNAWKYRTTPELWAHLYENIVESITANNPLSSCGLAIRTHIARVGMWRLALYAILSYLLVLPFAVIFNFLAIVSSVVGIAFLLFIASYIFKGSRVSAGFRKRFAKLTSYRQTLGLQAAIGDDLRNVIVAAVPNNYFIDRHIKKWLSAIVCVSIGLTVFVFWLSPSLLVAESLAKILPDISKTQILLSVGLWWLLFLFFFICATFSIARKQRLLLVVDDLDRCEPSQMLEIIESIKLLIEDEYLDDRVQVVMLVEEILLRDAILQKFELSSGTRTSTDTISQIPDHVLVDEHIDKLFLAYYRFPALESKDISAAASVFIDEQLRDVLKGLKSLNDRANDSEESNLREIIDLHEQLLSADTQASLVQEGGIENRRDTIVNDETTDRSESIALKETIEIQESRTKVEYSVNKLDGIVYSPTEKQALVSAASELALILKRSNYSCGPRAIRLFLYRYQLARLLSQSSDSQQWPPNQIIRATLLAYESRSPDTNVDWTGVDHELRLVVQSVI